MSDAFRVIAKPTVLTDFAEEVMRIYPVVRSVFDAPNELEFNVARVDEPSPPLNDAGSVGAFALRKLQALYFCALPQTLTTLDVIIGLAAELDRAIQGRVEELTAPDHRHALEGFMSMMSVTVQELMRYVDGDEFAPLQ